MTGPTYQGQQPEDHVTPARRVLRESLERTLEGLITQQEDNAQRLKTAETSVAAYRNMVPVHEARIAEFRAALAALDAREAADAPPAPRYVAVINTPGYLPMSDEPDIFDTAREAWDFLADQRQRDEDSALDAMAAKNALPPSVDLESSSAYSNTWRLLAQLGDAAAWLTMRDGDDQFISAALDLDSLSIHPNVNELGLGSVWGNTPGYDEAGGKHDLGIAYSVMIAEPDPHADPHTSDTPVLIVQDSGGSYTLCCNKGPHDHDEDGHFLLAPSDLEHHLPGRHGVTVLRALEVVNTEAAVRHIVASGIDDSNFDDETRRLMVWHEQFHGRDGS